MKLTVRLLKKWNLKGYDKYHAEATSSIHIESSLKTEFLGFALVRKYTYLDSYDNLEDFKREVKERSEIFVFLDELEETEDLEKRMDRLGDRISTLEKALGDDNDE